MTKHITYNGWKNWETWNVSLWIQNDEGLYNMAKQSRGDYQRFRVHLADLGGEIGVKTPDGVEWNDPKLDLKALDELLEDL